MKTRKPISTVSYNTVPFLEGVLERLVKNKVISFYAYVVHKGEDDENGKKDHTHIYVEPYSSIETEWLDSQFIEPDPNNIKPLKCLAFRNSKFDDWFLYGLHFVPYLMKKGLTKLYHYEIADMRYSDEDEFRSRSYGLTESGGGYSLYNTINNAMENGLTPNQIIVSGLIPPQFVGVAITYMAQRSEYLRNIDDGEKSVDAQLKAYNDGSLLLDELDKENNSK